MNYKKLLETQHSPFIEGNMVTWVWLGKEPPLLYGDFNWWGIGKDDKSADWWKGGPNVWLSTHEIASDAYVEYAFFEADGRTRVPDPNNPRRVGNGFGAYNHFFQMPDWTLTPLARVKRGVARGTLNKHTLPVTRHLVGKGREAWLYQPATLERVPLMVVLDGRDYVYKANLAQVMDNLIAQGHIPPMAFIGIQNAGESRFLEYGTSEVLLGAILRDILPYAEKHLNLLHYSEHRYSVMGASMGGIMSLYTALRVPDIFSTVICQSGAFLFDYAPQTPSLIDELLQLPKRNIRLWQDVGRYEYLVTRNREVDELLNNRGYDHLYREYHSGHNWTSWRNILVDALPTIFKHS